MSFSNFKDRIIGIILSHYKEEIEDATNILKEVVKLINLYINHQDKKYEKIFKEGVYCDLVYDKEIRSILPIVVLRSTKSESVNLRVTDLPWLSVILRKTDPENDDYDETHDAISSILNDFIDDEIESVYINEIISNADIDEDENFVDPKEYNPLLRHLTDQFFEKTSEKDILYMLSIERFFNASFDVSFNDVSASMHSMIKAIKSKNLFDYIFTIRTNLHSIEFAESLNPKIISKKIALEKYKDFNHNLIVISDDVLEYIIDTESIYIPITIGVQRSLPEININKDILKGVVKNIHIYVKMYR